MATSLRSTSADLGVLLDDGKRYEIVEYEQDLLQSPLLPDFTCRVEQLFGGIS